LVFHLAFFTPAGPASTALTALAATVLVGALIIVLATCARTTSRTAAALPLLRRVRALRERSWRVAFLRQRDPDARGRPRPRAPSAVLAAGG
jgi:hypothetical protein